jgi:lipoprotein-anchoring transpeptidase ErfK/SrfK
MKPARKPRGMRPGVAWLLLGIAASVFAWNLRPLLGGGGANTAEGTPVIGQLTAGEVAAAVEDADLLGRYGSYHAGSPVRAAFAPPGADAIAIAAAPLVESRPPVATAASPWRGPDPAQLRVSFVMQGGAIDRAVVNGVVVGIGDRIGGVTIVSIVKGGVKVQSGDQQLDYRMDSSWPLQFAGELQRRAAADDQAGRTDKPGKGGEKAK